MKENKVKDTLNEEEIKKELKLIDLQVEGISNKREYTIDDVIERKSSNLKLYILILGSIFIASFAGSKKISILVSIMMLISFLFISIRTFVSIKKENKMIKEMVKDTDRLEELMERKSALLNMLDACDR